MRTKIEFRCCTTRNMRLDLLSEKGVPDCVECGAEMRLSDLPPGVWLLKCDHPEYVVPEGENVVCLGELQNMKAHYVMVDQRGKVYPGLHLDAFRLIVS